MADERLFWRGVGPRLVRAAFVRYRDDFDIFGYDIGRYFGRLDLKGLKGLKGGRS